MNSQISSYSDLQQEKARLQALLQVQKQVLRDDVQKIKEELKPLKTAINFIRRITTKDKTNLLFNLGADFAINTVFKKFILSKTGWLTRIVVPFFLKNYSSHFFSEQKEKWLEKLRSWMGKQKQEDKHESAETEAERETHSNPETA